MGWIRVNRRKGARVVFDCAVTVKEKEGNLVLKARTGNVSIGGICVMLEKVLLKKTHVEVELFIPDEPAPIICGGKVAWSVQHNEYPKKKPSQFDTCIEFVDISDEDKARLKRKIEELLAY